jgi:prolyl-tRNA synthetase
MGCYGIGVSRTVAAAIEQNNDEYGIVWPMSIAPYLVDVIPANMKDKDQSELAEKLYAELKENNIDTIIDDRNERPGFKFKDADLIGFPIKLIVGRGAKDGLVEVKVRKTNEAFEVKVEEVIIFIKDLIEKG